MLFRLPTLPLFLPLLCFCQFSYAEPIRQLEQMDGIIEFSNVDQSDNQFQTNNKITAETLIYKADYGEFIGFSDQKPQNDISYEVLRFDCFACDPDSTINWHNVSLNTTAYSQFINLSALEYNVDPALIRALIHAESSFKADALSRTGAQGLMQLMPATADYLGVADPWDPKQNIKGGVDYIARLLAMFSQDMTLATAAYNAGPNAVKKYEGIPPYSETQVYVKRVATLTQRYQAALR